MTFLKDNILYSSDTTKVPDGFTSLAQFLEHSILSQLSLHGDRVVMQEAVSAAGEPRRRMLSQVLSTSRRLASALRKAGLAPGDVVQLSMRRNIDYFVVALGAWMAGATVSFADPTTQPQPIRQLLQAVQVKWVFCTPELLAAVCTATQAIEYKPRLVLVQVDSAEAESGVQTLDHLMSSATDGGENRASPGQWPAAPVASIFWSSGTTGEPKGIPWGQQAMICAMTNPFYMLASAEDGNDHVLSTVSMWHMYGVVVHLSNALCRQSTVYFFPDTSNLQMADIYLACHRYQPHTLVTSYYHGLLLANAAAPDQRLELNSVKLIIPIGNVLSDAVIAKLKTKFPNSKTLNGYGASEVGGVAMAYTYENLGELVRGMQVKIAAQDGQILGPNQVGEILVRSETQMLGYLGQPRDKAFTADGFYRTGDLGYFDAQGMLYFTERAKAAIAYGRYWIYPQQLEKLILGMPSVAEVGVFAITHELEEWVSAAIVPLAGVNITAQDVLDYVNTRVEWYQQIRGDVIFVESVPRNSMGKVLRDKLAKIATPLERSLAR